MRPLTLLAALCLSGCAPEPCVRQYPSVEPAHTCAAINCHDADSIEEWTDEWTSESGATTRTDYAVCTWDCVALANGQRARVTQTYSKIQWPVGCVTLEDEVIDTRRADCDRECETVR